MRILLIVFVFYLFFNSGSEEKVEVTETTEQIIAKLVNAGGL